jgi:hypothetical protein
LTLRSARSTQWGESGIAVVSGLPLEAAP